MKSKILKRFLISGMCFFMLAGMCSFPIVLQAEEITDQAEIDLLGADLTHPQTELPEGESIFCDSKTVFISETSGLKNAFDNASMYKADQPNGAWPTRSMCAKDKNYLGIGYTFATPKKIAAYSVSIGQLQWSRKARAPKTFTLFGTNDDPLSEDAVWENLGTGSEDGYEMVTDWINEEDEQATKDPQTRYFRCQEGASTGYTSFKWVATAPVSEPNGYIHVSELDFFGREANVNALPALKVSAPVPDWVKETETTAGAFTSYEMLSAGIVTIPVPFEFYMEEAASSRYHRSGYALTAYNKETAAYDIPVTTTLSEDGATLSFTYEGGNHYQLVWQYDFEHLVTCSVPDGFGTVSLTQAWVVDGETVTLTATPMSSEYTFLQWHDADGNKYSDDPLELVVTAPIEMTAQFWEIGRPFEWYIAEDGNDANDGLSPETAKATIKAALADVHIPGHLSSKIYLLKGTYHETNVIISDPVEILGQTGNPEDVVIEYNFGNAWNGSYRTFQILHAEAVIANLTCDNSYGGQSERAITVELTAGGTLSNCVIRASSFSHPYRRGSVWVPHKDARVTRCLFIENIVTGGEAEWHFHCGSSIYQTAGLVDNCVFIKNGGTNAAKTYPWTSAVLMEGGTLANCSFFENTGNKVGALWTEETEARVYNTVFYANTLIEGSKTPDYPYHNSYVGDEACFVNCAADEETMIGTGGIANLTEAAFRDYANGNYVPTGFGVLYNAGTTENVPKEALVLDFAGNARKIGRKVDIGAFEGPEAGMIITVF